MKPSNNKYYSYQITRRFLEAMDTILGNRQNGKVTLTSFGKIVGMTASNLNRLRSGSGKYLVTVEAIGRICDIYGISSYWLITGRGEMNQNDHIISAKNSISAKLKEMSDAVESIEKAIKIINPPQTKTQTKADKKKLELHNN